MFTGDHREAAEAIAEQFEVDGVRAEMMPEDKLCEIEKLEENNFVAMVGDGINDAPALARADLGIAMGSGGTAVTVEAADLVILTDDLSKLPEAISIGRRSMSVIRVDGIIWVGTNLIGFALVFLGVLGPAAAAFYNLVTDFMPLLNSTRLFRNGVRK
jgi:P-type E1-E2 ATPase